jgi:hypothetical protein
MTTIPDDWMPDVPMKRIHLHWTVGWYKPNDTDLRSYHILIDGDGKPVRGNGSIAANAPGSGMKQVSHTGGANTGAIGVSLCAMVKAKESPFDPGPHPFKKEQWDASVVVIAQLAKRYGIAVTPVTILTHAEVEPNLQIKQKGKWDITRLPFDDSVRGFKPVGEKLRREVAAVLDILKGVPNTPPTDPSLMLPRFRVRGVAPSTLNIRGNPGGEKVGALAEGTRVERLGIVDGWWRVRTPAGYTGWVWHSFLVPA